MRFRTFWRRAVAAAGIYGAAVVGILATIVAARELSTVDFARFALVFAITGLLQLFLDLSVEEVVVKYGNRYVARADWGRLRRLIKLGLQAKLVGGSIGALAIVIAALLAHLIFNVHGIRVALLVAALVPLVQAPEGIGGAVLLLRNRYDVRAGLLFWSMALRFAAIAIGASFGLVETFVAIVVAQLAATATMTVVALTAFRRYPAAPEARLAEDAREVRAFAVQSTIASGLASLRGLLPTVLVGVVARPAQVAYFRIAQAPVTAFASLSAPARLVLLAEQTRDIEHGRVSRAYRLLRRYIAATMVIVLVVVPPLWIWAGDLVRLVYGERYTGATNATRVMVLAAGVQLIFGWTKSFPVSIGRPGLRTAGQLLELLSLVPLVLVLGYLYGATGAAGAQLSASLVLALFWTIVLVRRAHRSPTPLEEATV